MLKIQNQGSNFVYPLSYELIYHKYRIFLDSDETRVIQKHFFLFFVTFHSYIYEKCKRVNTNERESAKLIGTNWNLY